jgi:Fe2+ transport system protein FeoA
MLFCKHTTSSQGQRTLCDLQPGKKAIVRALSKNKGCHIGKLAAMGITPGTEIEMISNDRGPLMILVRGSRLCLCRNLGQNIIIE